jgi:hypothetical protein
VPNTELPTAELEINLFRQDRENYGVELRVLRTNDKGMTPPQRATVPVADWTSLFQTELDANTYGNRLTETLFHNERFRTAFEGALDVTEGGSPTASVRLRLCIEPGSPELHSVGWETLRHPRKNTPIATNPYLYLSRFMYSPDWRPVTTEARGRLRALGVAANPRNLSGDLAPVEVDALDQIETALGEAIPLERLPRGSVTLDALLTQLKSGYEILFVICHGSVSGGASYLLFEKKDGNVDAVPATHFAERIAELEKPPRLIVLMSCRSAGNGELRYLGQGGEVLAMVGPRLTAAGVPAVLGIQGDISQEAGRTFLEEFARLLREDGEVDRVVNQARAKMRTQDGLKDESWRPVLFLRTRSGLWYSPGFRSRDGHKFDGWTGLLKDIRSGLCTPILGPDVFESLVASGRVVARALADQHRYSLAPYDRDALHLVAQYVGVQINRRTLRQDYLENYERLKNKGRRRGNQCRDAATRHPPDAGAHEKNANGMTSQAGLNPADLGENHPLNVLARLPFPYYINTSPHDELVQVLRAAGKKPEVDYCRWNMGKRDVGWPQPLDERSPDYQPSTDAPVVYQFFGQLNIPESLVLTEDDYFDYLINVTGITHGREGAGRPVPGGASARLANSGLLFLGFRLDDWAFRVFLRGVIRPLPSERWREYTHIAIQVHPEEDRFLNPEQACRYIERYFQEIFPANSFSVYWGSIDDFARDLRNNYQ